MKKYILAFILSSLLGISYAQSGKDSLVTVKLPGNCFGKESYIQIPSGYGEISGWSDTCEYLIDITYPDGSSIFICCGCVAIVTVKEEVVNEKYDKKVNVKGTVVCYYNVPRQRLHLFNKAFELLEGEITDGE